MKTIGQMTLTTPSDREIAMSRTFDAPRALVYRAYTEPALLKQWLGVHNGWVFAVCDIDLRVGGQYRWVWRSPKGQEMGMRGTYQEIVPEERIVSVEQFDDPWYEGTGLETVTFTEKAGQTTLVMTVKYDTQAIRDSVLASPMETGVAAGLEALADLLARTS